MIRKLLDCVYFKDYSNCINSFTFIIFHHFLTNYGFCRTNIIRNDEVLGLIIHLVNS